MYVDRELDRKHVEAILKVEEIKKRIGWEPGSWPQAMSICEYAKLVEAEEAAERAGRRLVERAMQMERVRPGLHHA